VASWVEKHWKTNFHPASPHFYKLCESLVLLFKKKVTWPNNLGGGRMSYTMIVTSSCFTGSSMNWQSMYDYLNDSHLIWIIWKSMNERDQKLLEYNPYWTDFMSFYKTYLWFGLCAWERHNFLSHVLTNMHTHIFQLYLLKQLHACLSFIILKLLLTLIAHMPSRNALLLI